MVQCANPITFKYILYNFIKKHKFLFVCYLILVLLVPLQDVGIPHIVGLLTKNIQKKASIYVPLTLLIVLTIIIQVGSIVNGLIDVKMFPAFQQFVREIIISHIMKESKTNYEELRTGELSMNLHKLPTMLYSYIEDMRDMIIPQFIVFSISIIYFSYYDIRIGLGLMAVIILLFFSVSYTIDKCEPVSTSRDNQYNLMMEEITDVFKNMTSVLNANTETREMQRNDEFQQDYYKLVHKSLMCSYRVRYYLIPFVLGFFAWTLNRMYSFVKIGKIKSHTMVSLVLILLYLMKSMWIVIYNLKDQVFRWGTIQASFKVLNNCAPEEKSTYTPSQNIPDGFYIEHVTYKYDGRKEIFTDLNLNIVPNKKTLIVGEIGSGKSTLIKLLMKYQVPEDGMIYYNRTPYSKISVEKIRELIGYVPQTPMLFNRTIYENIVYNNTSVTKEQVLELMYKFGLGEMIKKFPEGLDTNVGNGGTKLSGGQRQIVWILRVMLQNPEVVILDEPTSALDEGTKPIVQNMLENIIQNKTTIMITHDQYLYNMADTIVELKNGKVVSIKNGKE